MVDGKAMITRRRFGAGLILAFGMLAGHDVQSQPAKPVIDQDALKSDIDAMMRRAREIAKKHGVFVSDEHFAASVKQGQQDLIQSMSKQYVMRQKKKMN